MLAVSPALAAFVLSLPAQAAENKAVVRGLAKYIKKKQLDPLVTYVPLLLEARDQLIRTGRVMGECTHLDPAAYLQAALQL